MTTAPTKGERGLGAIPTQVWTTPAPPAPPAPHAMPLLPSLLLKSCRIWGQERRSSVKPHTGSACLLKAFLFEETGLGGGAQ